MNRYPQPYPTPYAAPGIALETTTPAVMGTGWVSVSDGATHADGEAVIILANTFELDKAGDGVTPLAHEVDILAGDTATQVRDKLLAVILATLGPVGGGGNGALTAVANGADRIDLTIVNPLQNNNDPITISMGAAFLYQGFEGGTEEEVTPATELQPGRRGEPYAWMPNVPDAPAPRPPIG